MKQAVIIKNDTNKIAVKIITSVKIPTLLEMPLLKCTVGILTLVIVFTAI